MIDLPNHIEHKFHNFIYGEVQLEEFEAWVYTEQELETILPTDDFLELISFNYKKSGARHELIELLFRRLIDRAKYKKWKMLKMLYTAQKGDERLANVLRQFYDLYCISFDFLKDLGLGYGLMIEVPPSKYKAETWEELSKLEKEELIQSLYPQLTADLQRAIDWIEGDKIIFKGTLNEMGYDEYIDLRTNNEKKSMVWKTVEDNNKPGENSFRVEENLLIKNLSGKPKTTFWSKLKFFFLNH